MAQANVKAVITAEDKASSVLRGFSDHAQGIGRSIANTLKVAAVATAAAGAAAVAFGVSAVKSFSESQDVIEQTNAVLKSTGQVAGMSAEQISNLASSLQKTTRYSDETIQSGENLLLTFTKIGKDIFPEATEVMLDMSTALGQDVKSSAIQLGKALQDPVLGITALRRVGVNFNDAQKDVIEKLVKTGRSAEAQKLILQELQIEFGGSAKAAGKTFAGSLDRLKNSFDDVKESVGKTIVDGLGKFTDKIVDILPTIESAFKNIYDAGRLLVTGDFSKEMFGGAFSEDSPLVERILKVREAIVKLVDFVKSTAISTFNFLKQAFDFLKPSLDAFWGAIKNDLLPALQKLWKEVIAPMAPVIGVVLAGAIWLIINYMRLWTEYISHVINIFSDLFNFLTKTLPQGLEAAFNWIIGKAIWLKDNFWQVVGFIIGFVATLPIKLPLLMAEAILGMIKAVISVNWSGIFSGIWQGMQSVWDRITNTVVTAWHKIRDMNWGDLFTGIGKSLANGLISLIEGALKGALKGLPGNIENKIKLPRFDSGGIVPGPIGQPQLAVVHGGETVLPTHKRGATTVTPAATTSPTINISFSGVFTGSEMEFRKLATKVFSAYQDAQGMRGA